MKEYMAPPLLLAKPVLAEELLTYLVVGPTAISSALM